MAAQLSATRWPYPRWIGHRGAGRCAPENTLAAFMLGHAHGFRMFECDVRLSADGVPFLLHDDLLERTSTGRGAAHLQAWAALRALDAGCWHSPAYRDEPLATLEQVAAFCQASASALNVELKPAPGADEATGTAVAALLERCWQAWPPPLLSSFSPQALGAARARAPQLPRALLCADLTRSTLACTLEAARALDCLALVVAHEALDCPLVAAVHDAGLRLLCYTVNECARAAILLEWGVDGVITDAIDYFDAAAQALLAKGNLALAAGCADAGAPS